MDGSDAHDASSGILKMKVDRGIDVGGRSKRRRGLERDDRGHARPLGLDEVYGVSHDVHRLCGIGRKRTRAKERDVNPCAASQVRDQGGVGRDEDFCDSGTAGRSFDGPEN